MEDGVKLLLLLPLLDRPSDWRPLELVRRRPLEPGVIPPRAVRCREEGEEEEEEEEEAAAAEAEAGAEEWEEEEEEAEREEGEDRCKRLLPCIVEDARDPRPSSDAR